ncbi:MAG: NUDIX hydrolase [Actinomycetota bacterium]|nr:NUDIX hydrolase [Actinomycetota bacterium]
MSDDGRHSVAVAAIVFDEQRRVLVMRRRDHGNWEPPGGVLKVGESPLEGVRREVFEETGVDIRVGPLTGVYTNVEEGVVTLAFRGEARSQNTTQSEEAASVRWVPPRETADLLSEEYGDWIEDARSEGLQNVRTQHGTVKGTSESPET